MSKNEYKFDEKYKDLKNEYPSLISLPVDITENIQSQIKRENKKVRTNNYLLSVIGASLAIILFPFLIVKIYVSFNVVPELLEKILNLISEENIDIFNFSFGFGSLAILMYLFLLPSFKIFGKSFLPKNELSDINKKQSSFIFFAVLGVYTVIGLVSFLLLLNYEPSKSFVLQGFKFYLFAPVSIISFFLFVFLIVIIFMLPFTKAIDKKFEYCSNTRIDISIYLILILEKLKDQNNGDFLPQNDIKFIVNKLNKVRLIIKAYPKEIAGYLNEQQIINDFAKASNEFESLITDIIENQETNFDLLKEKLVTYLNIFLKGNLSDLPKSNDLPSHKKTKSVKAHHYIILGLYLTLPIIIVIFLKISFDIELDNYTQSLLRILYIIWAFVGIFSNPFTFNNENRDLMKELIKTLLGKG